MKKFIINIAVIALAFIIFIVWHQNFILRSVQTSSHRLKYYDVYLITTDKEYQYWSIMNQGATDMASSLGVDYIWDAPAVRNVDKQIEVIRNAVDSGANALLVAADDPKLISGVIEDAKARGVKVIYVDSPAYEEAITTLATDNYEAGVRAGQAMLSILDKKEIKSGSIGIINYAAKANTELREKGFRETLAKDGRFNILDTIYTTSGDPKDAQADAERLMNENEDLVGLFGVNEGTSVGVGNAIKANDNKYVGVGFDKTDEMMKLLQDGNLKAIIVQNPYTMGYLGVAEAVAALLGKDTGPDFINTGVSVISNY